MKQKRRTGQKLLSFLLALVMVIGLMPGMGMKVYAVEATQSAENDYVWYGVGTNGFDVRGKSGSGYISTTYHNGGYRTAMQVGDGSKIQFTGFAYGKEYTSDNVTAYVTAGIRGKDVNIKYTVTNNGTEEKTVKIGSSADTQIGNNDSAPITMTETGISMTDGTNEFKLIAGDGNFTTRWYGGYSSAYNNMFVNRADTSTYNGDSGVAWSWTITIPAGGAVTKTAILSAGASSTYSIYYDANGGTGEMEPTVEVGDGTTQVTLRANTYTKEGYRFLGWDTNSAGENVVYADGASFVMPNTDTTVYAVWEALPAVTYDVVFKVVNGSWNDESTDDKTVTLTGYEGDTLKLAADQIPAVGSKPDENYKAGSWTVEPSTETAITAATTYTYTYAEKDATTVTTRPTANTLTYNGSEQELVTAGEADVCELQYALGTDSDTAPTEGWSASIPTGTEVGTYYVWFKVVGDEEHSDSEPGCVIATIAAQKKADSDEESEHTHHYVWETTEATEDHDGELRYICTVCGSVQTSVPVTAYYVFNKNTTEKIRNAGQGATVKIETNKWISFHKMVMEALAERPDVTLEISFLDGEYKGNRLITTIPAGTDTLSLLDEKGFSGFLYLAGKFGATIKE